ncbi:hypothetical protein [Sulfurihydrogenibium subterraneum]|uniref:hypothetical protein n=1 Tax=Sulfurihydrogenibium subterraneum TaxID=171121 RepID=UPI00048D6D56|nr:hypothetical protein [Sulfurihydrogenibium subterraneum]
MNPIKESSLDSNLTAIKNNKAKQKIKFSVFDLILSKETSSKESLKPENKLKKDKNIVEKETKLQQDLIDLSKQTDNVQLHKAIEISEIQIKENLKPENKTKKDKNASERDLKIQQNLTDLSKQIDNLQLDKPIEIVKIQTTGNLKPENKPKKDKNITEKGLKLSQSLNQIQIKTNTEKGGNFLTELQNDGKHNKILDQLGVLSQEDFKYQKTLPQQNLKQVLTQAENQSANKLSKLQNQDSDVKDVLKTYNLNQLKKLENNNNLNENKLLHNTSLKNDEIKVKRNYESIKETDQIDLKKVDIKIESKKQDFLKSLKIEREDFTNNINNNILTESFKNTEKQSINTNLNSKSLDQNTNKSNNLDFVNTNNATAVNYDLTSGYNSSKSAGDNANSFTQNQHQPSTSGQSSFQNFNITYQNTNINAVITQTTLNLFIKSSDVVFTPEIIDSIKNILKTSGYKDLKLTLKDREKVYKVNSIEKLSQPTTEKGINIAV